MLLTALGWGLAYADGFSKTLRITLVFVFGHFLLSSLLVSTAAYFLVGKLLGPGIAGLPGRSRRAGLFGPPGNDPQDQLEFGYCFDVCARTEAVIEGCAVDGKHLQVSIRAFLPVWVFLYVIQFLLMPVIARDYWVSLFFGNSLYLVAFGYYFVVSFLGYNGTSSSIIVSSGQQS